MRPRHVLITGAGGFIGSALATRIADDSSFGGARLTLVDRTLPDAPQVATRIEGDITDGKVLAHALGGKPDLVFHLAGILGGAAEANYDLARRVNLHASLDLMESVRSAESPPRFIFASSIAVYGVPLPARVDDATIALPSLTYGAQKLMLETAVTQFSNRGWIDGLSLRFPGIVARPGADSRLKSAFLNNMFFNYRDGADFILPVAPGATTWLISLRAVVDALVHASQLERRALPMQRAFVLPAQRVTIAELLAGLAKLFPESRSIVQYDPDEQLEAQFARFPPLIARIAENLGFRHDGDIENLIRNAISAGQTQGS